MVWPSIFFFCTVCHTDCSISRGTILHSPLELHPVQFTSNHLNSVYSKVTLTAALKRTCSLPPGQIKANTFYFQFSVCFLRSVLKTSLRRVSSCNPVFFFLQGSVCSNTDLSSLCTHNLWSESPVASSDRLIVMLSHTWLHHRAAQTHHQCLKEKTASN